MDEIPELAKCPCCEREVVLARQNSLAKNDKKLWKTYATLAARGKYFSSRSKREEPALYWACDKCVAERRAIRADVRKQKYAYSGIPYLAYFDEERECVDCGTKFLFTKEEQLHWYEMLKFWPWSRPVRCKGCNTRRKAGGKDAG